MDNGYSINLVYMQSIFFLDHLRKGNCWPYVGCYNKRPVDTVYCLLFTVYVVLPVNVVGTFVEIHIPSVGSITFLPVSWRNSEKKTQK